MLRALIDRVWPYLAGLAGLTAGLFYVRQSGKAAGRRVAEVKQNEAERAAAQRARHVEDQTAAMGDDAVTDELIRDWVRDRKR